MLLFVTIMSGKECEKMTEPKLCGNCKRFAECVTESANIAGLVNTPEEIEKCSNITACPEFVEAEKGEGNNG